MTPRTKHDDEVIAAAIEYSIARKAVSRRGNLAGKMGLLVELKAAEDRLISAAEKVGG